MGINVKRRPYKIALISTHGTGKTTLCFDVAAELKKRGFKVKVFSEIAAAAYEQGIPINENTTLPAQLYILMQHITEELRAAIRNYQIVVCDRSVFDNWVYMERRCGGNAFILEFLRGYADKFPYDAIYKLPMVGELMEDGIRDAQNKAFQTDIYARLNTLLEELKIPHKTLPVPVSELRKEWADLIVNDTLSALAARSKTDKNTDGVPSPHLQ
jgi:hypothetical protein